MSADAEVFERFESTIDLEPVPARRPLQKAVDALSRTFALPEESDAPAKQRERRWRALRIGNLGLLVAHDCGGELIEDAKVCPLPRTASWCRGLINLRGQLIPAFDLHESFGVARLRPQQQWWLALGRDDDAVAFPVDALPASFSVSGAADVQSTVIPERLREFVDGAYRIDGELWLEFRHLDFFRSLGARAAA